MFCSFLWPKRPSLPSELLAELELHGADAMRALLTSSTDGFSGTGRAVQINLGHISVTRGEIQDWLKWKAAIDALWVKAGVIFAFAAAIFSLIAIFKC